MDRSPDALVRGRGYAQDWAECFAEHGVQWEVDGHNMLALARDTQRWDVLSETLERDLPGTLAVLRDVPHEELVALLLAFLQKWDQRECDADVGIMFPLSIWRERCLPPSDDIALTWLSDNDAVPLFAPAFFPSARNPPRWDLDPAIILELCDLHVLDDLRNAGVVAAASTLSEDPHEYGIPVEPAMTFLNAVLGEHVAVAPDGARGRIRCAVDAELWLVELKHGGWTVHGHSSWDGDVGERVTIIHPLPVLPRSDAWQRRSVLGPFAFTPF